MFTPLCLLVSLSASPDPQADPLDAAVQHALEFAELQLDAATRAFASTSYPSWTSSAGAWVTTGPSEWTSGFFPGCLWLLHDWSGDARWRDEAERWSSKLGGEAFDTSTHDVGFKILPSFGNAARLTGEDAPRLVVLDGATSLATRYNPIVRATRSWDGPTPSDFRVIVDNMMNLEILFLGARSGGSAVWYDMAVSHALTTRAQHVRSDGSTYQIVDFDPATGAVDERATLQGLDTESTWSRGQAWALHGFAIAYENSGDARFLETARATAEYFCAHLPADSVPYWDFELPSPSGEPRDSSAAAIAAAGLLELARLEPDVPCADRWYATARAILAALTSPAYLAEGTGADSLLLHGTRNRPAGAFDEGLIVGDYYFLQALLAYQRLYGPAPSVAGLELESAPGVPLEIALEAADRDECELAFAIVGQPAHGTLGSLVPEACRPGTPNRDRARVVYYPAPGFEGLDSFSYRASDGVNTSTPATVAIDVQGRGRGLTYLTLADSKVSSAHPNRNHGTETTLRLRASGPEWRSYVKFQVGALPSPIASARLRLFVSDGSDQLGRVFAVGNAWTESSLTWNNAPAPVGSALATLGAVPDGVWVELDVGAFVTGSGTFSFVLTSPSTNGSYLSSREGAHPPELVVETRGHVRAAPAGLSRP